MSGLAMVTDEQDSGGKAADTGSAVHMAASIFHGQGAKDVSVSVAVMRGAIDRYPFADLDAAEVQFRHYAKDERNRDAEVVLNEAKVCVKIPPAEDDPTQKEIVINGTLDQVRRENMTLVVYDIKTGSMHEGLDMLHEHLFQLVVYQLGACAKLGLQVSGAGLIRTKDYLKKTPGPVFWRAPWRLSQCAILVKQIAARVACIRRGDVSISPSGSHCRWCPLGSVSNCVPKLEELR